MFILNSSKNVQPLRNQESLEEQENVDMVQDVYDISDLVGAGDSNITDAEIVEEARGIKNLIMALMTPKEYTLMRAAGYQSEVKGFLLTLCRLYSLFF